MRLAFVLIGLLTLATSFGCAHDEVQPNPVDPAGFAEAWSDFESAWNELELAIRATPRWETRPAMKVRVEGIAEIAAERAGRLAAWNGPELMNPAIIALLQAEVRTKAMIDSSALPTEGGDLLLETDPQLKSAGAERAWNRITGRLEMLEAYAAGTVRSTWLEQRVIARDVSALDALAELTHADTMSWRRIRVNEGTFEEVQERVSALRGSLSGGDAR